MQDKKKSKKLFMAATDNPKFKGLGNPGTKDKPVKKDNSKKSFFK